jgi:ribosomal protein S21
MFDKRNKKDRQIDQIAPGRSFSVKVLDGDLSAALRSWKKILKENDIPAKLLEKSFYTKPSKNRKDKRDIAVYKQKKESENESY